MIHPVGPGWIAKFGRFPSTITSSFFEKRTNEFAVGTIRVLAGSEIQSELGSFSICGELKPRYLSLADAVHSALDRQSYYLSELSFHLCKGSFSMRSHIPRILTQSSVMKMVSPGIVTSQGDVKM